MLVEKYLSNFWITLEIYLISCEINHILSWSKNCVIFSVVAETRFTITDTKVHIQVVSLSTQDNEKLLEQLNSVFKRAIV